jgi:hypothetical protein
MFWMCVLVILLSARLAQGGPIPSLCFEASPADTETRDLSFRLSSELGTDFSSSSSGCDRDLSFRLSSALGTDFSSSSISRGGGVDGILGGAALWEWVAGTASQATRLLFGIDLNANQFIQSPRRLEIAPQVPDRPGVGPFDAQREDAPHIWSPFGFGASRKGFVLGFGIEW